MVIDASLVVAALVDSGPDGVWAESVLESESLAAPHLMPAEVANILRRSVIANALSDEAATLAHLALLKLRVELFAYEPFGARIWELRGNLTPYDAWYVALAESLNLPLATLDGRLARAPGPRCRFQTPP
jgi:predicted nucleic acid-binding protein